MSQWNTNNGNTSCYISKQFCFTNCRLYILITHIIYIHSSLTFSDLFKNGLEIRSVCKRKKKQGRNYTSFCLRLCARVQMHVCAVVVMVVLCLSKHDLKRFRRVWSISILCLPILKIRLSNTTVDDVVPHLLELMSSVTGSLCNWYYHIRLLW